MRSPPLGVHTCLTCLEFPFGRCGSPGRQFLEPLRRSRASPLFHSLGVPPLICVGGFYRVSLAGDARARPALKPRHCRTVFVLALDLFTVYCRFHKYLSALYLSCRTRDRFNIKACGMAHRMHRCGRFGVVCICCSIPAPSTSSWIPLPPPPRPACRSLPACRSRQQPAHGHDSVDARKPDESDLSVSTPHSFLATGGLRTVLFSPPGSSHLPDLFGVLSGVSIWTLWLCRPTDNSKNRCFVLVLISPLLHSPGVPPLICVGGFYRVSSCWGCPGSPWWSDTGALPHSVRARS